VLCCCQGIIIQGSVIACERVAAQYRAFAGTMIGVFWAVATCLLALLAYLVQNWVHLQLIISLISLLTIPLYWYVTHMDALLLSTCVRLQYRLGLNRISIHLLYVKQMSSFQNTSYGLSVRYVEVILYVHCGHKNSTHSLFN